MKSPSIALLFLTLFSTCTHAAPDATGAPYTFPVPTPEQAEWQDDELSMFFHIDMPIYTDGGKGNGVNWKECGHLDPSLFNPAKLDTDQWMEAAKALGAKHTVFVAKHCSGFLTWQSDAYPYGLKQTKWRDGKGDILRDYVESSKKAGIKPGIYVSWASNGHLDVALGKVNMGKGDDTAKQAEYIKTFEKMITEAYGNYGPLFEIWFDGGLPPVVFGGPNAIAIMKKLQPQAIVFGAPTGTCRWVGNEQGKAPDPCWATVPDYTKSNNQNAVGAGIPDGPVWAPAECDVPVRNHEWFWRPGGESKLYSLDELMEMYYQSVGRNSNLMLNANIDRDGLVPEVDMKRYKEFGDEIRRRFGKSLAETTGKGDSVVLNLGKPTRIDHVIAMEDIRQGERIRDAVVEGLANGVWKELGKAECIGHKRILRFAPVDVEAVRLRALKSVAEPLVKKLAVYDVEGTPK